MTSDDCTCGDAGACFVPADHYRDCPQYEETHIVTDASDDPEHADDCPGCMTCPSPCGVCPRADNINGRCYCDEEEKTCNGICLTAADIGLGEYGSMIAYAHPDCPEHGDPLEEDPERDVCGGGDEYLRYVREEDVSDYKDNGHF